jgi:pyruvate/2-oxoglutarate dehydrogenase complex dihydrolipoamide acyltransferase (E2) component
MALSGAAERLAAEGDFKDVPLTQIRKTIARRLSESNGPVPTFFLTAEFDVSRAAEMRTQLAEEEVAVRNGGREARRSIRRPSAGVA